ncbi:MAG: hypothetical protein ABIO02_04935 [Patescibacteria group bacterium]
MSKREIENGMDPDVLTYRMPDLFGEQASPNTLRDIAESAKNISGSWDAKNNIFNAHISPADSSPFGEASVSYSALRSFPHSDIKAQLKLKSNESTFVNINWLDTPYNVSKNTLVDIDGEELFPLTIRVAKFRSLGSKIVYRYTTVNMAHNGIIKISEDSSLPHWLYPNPEEEIQLNGNRSVHVPSGISISKIARSSGKLGIEFYYDKNQSQSILVPTQVIFFE